MNSKPYIFYSKDTNGQMSDKQFPSNHNDSIGFDSFDYSNNQLNMAFIADQSKLVFSDQRSLSSTSSIRSHNRSFNQDSNSSFLSKISMHSMKQPQFEPKVQGLQLKQQKSELNKNRFYKRPNPIVEQGECIQEQQLQKFSKKSLSNSNNVIKTYYPYNKQKIKKSNRNSELDQQDFQEAESIRGMINMLQQSEQNGNTYQCSMIKLDKKQNKKYKKEKDTLMKEQRLQNEQNNRMMTRNSTYILNNSQYSFMNKQKNSK